MKLVVVLAGIVILALAVVFPGVATLSTVGNTTPCAPTVTFYALVNGVVGTAPLGSVSLVSAQQAVGIWQVYQYAWTGLSATYSGSIPPSNTYVATANGHILDDWGTYQGVFYSTASGKYNTDGSCTNPGGLLITGTTSSYSSTSSVSTSSIQTTKTATQTSVISSTVISSTTTGATTTQTIASTTASSSIVSIAPPGSAPIQISAFLPFGVGIAVLGLIIPRKWFS